MRTQPQGDVVGQLEQVLHVLIAPADLVRPGLHDAGIGVDVHGGEVGGGAALGVAPPSEDELVRGAGAQRRRPGQARRVSSEWEHEVGAGETVDRLRLPARIRQEVHRALVVGMGQLEPAVHPRLPGDLDEQVGRGQMEREAIGGAGIEPVLIEQDLPKPPGARLGEADARGVRTTDRIAPDRPHVGRDHVVLKPRLYEVRRHDRGRSVLRASSRLPPRSRCPAPDSSRPSAGDRGTYSSPRAEPSKRLVPDRVVASTVPAEELP